jgi:hypothetical protein
MAGLFESVKRALTGQVLHKIDIEMGRGTWGGAWTLSLRLKRHRSSGDKYVVLAALAAGNYQYYTFEWDEFDQFIEAAKRIHSAAQSSSASVPTSSAKGA